MSTPSDPQDDSAHPAGTTWRYRYASGHAGLITKVSALDYLLEVEAPGAATDPLIKPVSSLQAGIDAANAHTGADSAVIDWRVT